LFLVKNFNQTKVESSVVASNLRKENSLEFRKNWSASTNVAWGRADYLHSVSFYSHKEFQGVLLRAGRKVITPLEKLQQAEITLVIWPLDHLVVL
jgi:hypothetical protein